MLERYTRERQRGQGKKGLFNLEEDDGLDGFDEGLGGLTHGGRSVLDLPGDDFMMQGLGEEDEEEKGIDRKTVDRVHFGGFEEPEPDRVKSKQEVMAEIIAKSKGYKVGDWRDRADLSTRDSSSVNWTRICETSSMGISTIYVRSCKRPQSRALPDWAGDVMMTRRMSSMTNLSRRWRMKREPSQRIEPRPKTNWR